MCAGGMDSTSHRATLAGVAGLQNLALLLCWGCESIVAWSMRFVGLFPVQRLKCAMLAVIASSACSM